MTTKIIEESDTIIIVDVSYGIEIRPINCWAKDIRKGLEKIVKMRKIIQYISRNEEVRVIHILFKEMTRLKVDAQTYRILAINGTPIDPAKIDIVLSTTIDDENMFNTRVMRLRISEHPYEYSRIPFVTIPLPPDRLFFHSTINIK